MRKKSIVMRKYFYPQTQMKGGEQLTFYDNVKRACDERGISIAKLEMDLFGKHSRNIYKWKDHNPNVMLAQKVADLLEVDISELTKDVPRWGEKDDD